MVFPKHSTLKLEPLNQMKELKRYVLTCLGVVSLRTSSKLIELFFVKKIHF
jgi:hypothetical protein